MRVVANSPGLAGWNRLIQEAVSEPNPTLSNLKVTRAHHLLSRALLDVVGPDGGANFHTWAVWGSRKAGVTIREEGLDRAMREVTILAFCTGLLAGFLLGVLLWSWLDWWIVPVLSAVGAGVGAWTGRRWLSHGRRRAAELMLEGNRTVLEDIGGQTARFVSWFHESGLDGPESLAEFLAGFRPGRTEAGGQDLLRRAFAQYHRAALADNLHDRQQAVYFGNCLAILHEHVRLQPYTYPTTEKKREAVSGVALPTVGVPVGVIPTPSGESRWTGRTTLPPWRCRGSEPRLSRGEGTARGSSWVCAY